MRTDAAGSSVLEVHLLGPFELVLAGRAVHIGSPKQRAVLALLALQAGRVVSCDALCDLVWEKDQPASPLATLQSLISRLRRALTSASSGLVEAGELLRTREPGWVLNVDPAAVDALRFQELTSSARRHLRRGDEALAAGDLTEAIHLWRGGALADVVVAGYLLAEATHLDEARLDAIEDLAEAELATGRLAEALARLEAHVEANPLRERAWGLLMLALYRLGRQAAALRAFQQIRGILGEELGLQPSPELADMEQRILRHDPALSGPSRAESAVAGSRTLRDAAPRRPAPEPFTQAQALTVDDTMELLERKDELAILDALIDGAAGGQGRVGLIDAAPGMGKSRLLSEVRRRAAAAGMRVLRARGGELEREFEFGVVRQLFEPVLAEHGESLFTGGAEAARSVFDLTQDQDRDANSSFTFLHGLYRLTVNLTDDSPLAVVVDDLHSCDRASLRFLAYLVRRLEGLPVLVLASTRTTLQAVDRSLAGEIAGDPLTVVIRPRPLSEDATARLVRARVGDDAAATLAATCYSASGGNPLLLEELLKRLAVDRNGLFATPSGTGLVGRAAELCRLRAAFDRAAVGRGGLVLVSGDPGVGKTRLVEELAYLASRGGAVVAWGRCHPGASTAPFWPWTQVLRGVLAEVEPVAPHHEMAAAAQLVPELKGAAPTVGAQADPAHARFQLCQDVAAFVQRAGATRCLVVVLDDLHWADAPSVELLAALVSRLAGSRVLVVGTYRDLELREDPALVDGLTPIARAPSIERIRLVGMREPDCARLIASEIGREPSGELVRAVHARTDGNPFFVAELLRLLEEEGSLTTADPAAVLHSPVPVGVREVIMQRLGRLSDTTKHLLTIAAVAGREFHQRLLDVAGGVTEEESLAAVELALSDGIITESEEAAGCYGFSHTLIQDTIYAGISGLRRARLHGRVGEALESLADERDVNRVADLAYHFAKAVPAGGAEKAFRYAVAAADAAGGQLAYERAEEHLRRAVELVPSLPLSERPAAELRALARLGALLAATRGQASSDVREVFERASALCRHGDCSRDALTALWGCFYSCYVRGELDAARAVARNMLASAAPGAPGQEVVMAGHLAMGIASFHTGQLAKARNHLLATIEIADRSADPTLAGVFQVDPRVYARSFFALILALTGAAESADETARNARGLAAETCQPFTIATAAMLSAWLGFLCTDPASTSEHAAATVALADEHGFPLLAAAGRAFEGWAMARRGELDAAAVRVANGLAAFRPGGEPLRQPLFIGLEAEVANLRGSPEQALAMIDEALSADRSAAGHHYFDAALYRLRAEILLGTFPHRAAEARANLGRAVEIARAQGAEVLRARAQRSLELVDHL